MNRGDVVIIDFSSYDPADKVRPALVVQNDRDNQRVQKTIVAAITGNTRRVGLDTQYLIDRAHPDFSDSGLHGDSCVNCLNLYTIKQSDIAQIIGSLSLQSMQEIDKCLKGALGLT